ncbi:MAG: hypothetical protein V3V62_11550 [bacterium]
MDWKRRAARLAVLCLLAAPLLGAAGEGVPPGERGRLPLSLERDALSLFFEEADLFLAPEKALAAEKGEAAPDAVRWRLAWRNPKGFSPRDVSEKSTPPPMVFLGWGLTLGDENALATAAFSPEGRLLGAALSPPDRMTENLRGFLKGLVGRTAGEARRRLRLFAEVHREGKEGRAAAEWVRLISAFAEGRPAPTPPPARKINKPPAPGTVIKIFGVMIVIALAGFASMALSRQRRRKQEEESAEKAFRKRYRH